MIRLSFFNNKGGVGKTTLACNIASSLATHFDKAVLLVDADPQCNATQLLLSEELQDDVYSASPQLKKKATPRTNTLYDVLEPIAKGDSGINYSINPIRRSRTRFNIDVLPGNPKVALLEDRLSQAWVDFGSGIIGGARRTNWAVSLTSHFSENYDVILFDVGPSLGALNRSVLVASDFFITPMGCDNFSIMGISNIASWLGNWKKTYHRAFETCNEESTDNELIEFGIRDLETEPLKYAGYTVQQYVAKTIRGEKRATVAYEKILKKIPATISRELTDFIPDGWSKKTLHLGDVPNMYSLVPLAQEAHAPVHGVESKDGLVGAQYAQKEKYSGFIRSVAGSVVSNLGLD